MDPPEDESASLMIDDESPPPPPDASFSPINSPVHNRPPLYPKCCQRDNYLSSSASPPSLSRNNNSLATPASSANYMLSSTLSSTHNGRKKMIAIVLLASLVLTAVLSYQQFGSRIEKVLMRGTVENAMRDQTTTSYKSSFDVEATETNTTYELFIDTESISLSEQSSPQTEQSATQSQQYTGSLSSMSSAPANRNNSTRHRMIGFHEPSIQSINRQVMYYKPKGVGYPLRPMGGLHPLYYLDNVDTIAEDFNAFNDSEKNDDIYQIKSPYADSRLKLTDEERNREQLDYLQDLQKIRDNYGYWNFTDSYYSSVEQQQIERPVMDWSTVKCSSQNDSSDCSEEGTHNVLLGEIEKGDFPQGVWQTDNTYILNFHKEARGLIHRVREAIYAEYGWATSELSDDQLSSRASHFGIHIVPSGEVIGRKSIDISQGICWMHESSFNAFVKKLLNAMITNDHFFVVLGGHSAAAGHGNNFHQSYMMEFQNVMESVFDRLGMVLVSANRAQGGMGTAQAALAGGSIYGEKDFMIWDSSMTEKGDGPQDLFMRQMLLTGHRVAILFDMGGGKITMDRLYEEVGAHVGGMTSGNPTFLKQTMNLEQAESLPFALRHLFCASGVQSCSETQYKYNAKCWTDREDVVPPKTQNVGYGSQVSWHPGFRSHLWIARKLSLLFLHALDEAINIWEKVTASEGNPLDGKYWHIYKEEESIRNKLRNIDVSITECGKFLSQIPRVCATPMRGATEWAPRANPDTSSIRNLLKSAPNGYVPGLIDLESPPQLYLGRDPHFPSQRIPRNEIDVAAVARSISTHYVDADQRRKLLSPMHTSLHHETGDINSLTKHKHHRHLESNIIPGEGWTVIGHPAGFCDGTSNAVCSRAPSSDCLMSGHMDSRGTLVGDALSGWITFSLKDVKEGIFMARIQTWEQYYSNKRTEGWDVVNNGRDDHRQLKAPPPPIPAEFSFEVAVNGILKYSLNNTELPDRCSPHIAYNVPLCVLVDDKQLASTYQGVNIEISLRIVGGGRKSVLGITHVYYA